MSNEVTLFSGGKMNLPSHIANRELNTNTLALTGSNINSKRISIEGGVYRMIVDGKEVAKNKNREMNVVIVRTAPATSRVFYDPSVTYVRGQATAPLCSSSDGVRPDARIAKPQASSCDKCPQNIAGSGQGDSRACRYQRRLAVVLDGDISGDVYQLALPATSLFGKGAGGTQQLPLEAYARMLASNRVNIDSVVTKLEFDTDASTPKLFFSAVRFLEPDELKIVEEQAETTAAEQAVGMLPYALDAKPTEAPKETPVAEEAPAKTTEAKPAKGGFVASDDDEDEAPPVKTTKAKAKQAEAEVAEPEVKKAEPAPSSKISSVLAAWGDDDDE